ncbi:MAG TPA: gliding motility-associated C-terminal domain-containing protein [Ferruginibacter sp.]|jgi:gliding motility-associated-like protein|nr:gliding motility-associated C-terminal domain-containing protein [Ferruginibacter sp.]
MTLFTFSVRKALLFLFFFLLSIFQVAYATNIQSTGAGGAWNSTASWSPAQVPTAGDVVTINSGSPVSITIPAACATITVNTGATLTMLSSITVTGSVTVNGTLNCTTNFIFGACSFTLANSNSAFLMIGDPGGITTNPTLSGNIENTGGRSFPSSANYMYDGVANQNTGSGLPTTINGGGSLTIDNTGTSPTNVVTLTAATSSIQNINLQAGSLSLNGKTVTVNGTILNTGGNLATTSAGADGGNFIINGASLTGPTTFYNLNCVSTNSTITTSGLNSPLIDGTLLINSSIRFGGTNSPRYASGSTLSYAGNPNNRGLEWNADLTTTPTIGVTQGYPYNVFINSGSDFDICNYKDNGNDGAIPRGLAGNLTTSALTMLDWINYSDNTQPAYYLNPLLNQTGSFTVGGNMIVNAGGNINMSKIGGSGAFTITGSLTINGAGANVDLDSMTNIFSVGNGITLNNGSLNVGYTGVATKLQVTGDIVQNGGTITDSSGVMSLTGNFTKTGGTFSTGKGTVDFDGSTTQTFTTNLASETFNSLIIANTSANVVLAKNLTVNDSLLFTKGLLVTGANTLTMATGGIVSNASQSTGWVDGNLQRNITGTSPYVFDVGDATKYTPATITFNSVTTPGEITVSSAGPFTSMPGLGSFALSTTSYADRFWTITKNSGTYGNYTGAFTYGTASLTGIATPAALEAGVYNGTSWTYPSSSYTGGTTITATGITALGGAATTVALAICVTPTTYAVTGGGAYCAGGAGEPVGLNNSQNGINYQLQIGGTNTGAPVAGTGAVISFGNQTAAGTYTVVATNTATACTNPMTGSAVVSINALPTPTFTAQPGASICNNTSATYTTQAGQTNYIWTIPGTAGTAYTITSGGTATDNTVTLTWLTAGSKTVKVNYSSAVGSCLGAAPASSTTTVNASPVPTYTGIPPAEICVGNSVTYATQVGNSNYLWSVPGTNGVDYTIISGGTGTTNAFVSLTWLTQGTKTVTVNYTGGGCPGALAATNTTVVDPVPVPTFTTAPSSPACINSSATYTTQTGQVGYTWAVPGVSGTDYTITSGGIGTTDSTVTVTWLTSGSKTVTVNYYNATTFCTGATPASSTITVNSILVPTFTVMPAAGICLGSSATYTTQAAQTNYVWSVPGVAGTDYSITSGGIGTTNNTVTITWLSAGSKTVTVNYGTGSCASSVPASSTTTVNTPLTASFTAPVGTIACQNTTVTYVTQAGQTNYIWTIPGIAGTDYTVASGGTSSDNTIALTWLTSSSKIVTVSYTSGDGCPSTTASSTTTVNALPAPTFTTSPTATTCINSDATYTTQSGETNYIWAIPGTAGVDYTITSGGANTDNTVTLKWLTAGSKTVAVNYSNSANCTAATATTSTPTTVSIGPDASNLTIPSATPACMGISGSTVTVNSNTLAATTYTVTYNLGAPNTATNLTATMVFSADAGTFTVPSGNLSTAGATTITITGLQNSSCNTSGLSTLGTITVNSMAIPSFTTEPPGASACASDNVIYTTQSGQSDYVWSYSGTLNSDYSIVTGGSSSDNTVTIEWLNTIGSKTVSVNYTSTTGCSATGPTSSTPIAINICNILPLYIPSGFAANGKNPIWHIANSEDYPNMQVQVYNRWGKKVFECKGFTAWDGTLNGQNLPMGVYTYEIKVNDPSYKKVLSGTITLIR